jgi:peptidoglycan/xylan/chitin deacetylase (PgdA/CDA1 family)
MILNLFKRKKVSNGGNAVVLMYHRIANLRFDPWQLAVTPENFERHLELLSRRFNLISVKELITQIGSGNIHPNSVCISFDDGYADNFINAKPLLQKYKCPATFFIASSFIQERSQFWWDELQSIILEADVLPSVCSLLFNNKPFYFDLKEDIRLIPDKIRKQKLWIWSWPPANRRCELYLKLWEILKPMPYNQIKESLTTIYQWAKAEPKVHELDLPMTIEQLEEIANDPLFNLGLHTATHPSLSSHTKTYQFEDIENNKKFFNNSLHIQPTIIAYPYGDYNNETISIVQSNLKAGFTTQACCVDKKSDIYSLGRFQVVDCSSKKLEKQIKNWFKKA